MCTLTQPQTLTPLQHGSMSLSPGACGSFATSPATHLALRKRSKSEVCEAFLQRLRERHSFDLDLAGVIEGIQEHFQQLPSRYALDVNINSLDVLNHKRLLDSARADPSAVSFQVRPVDVVTAAGYTSTDRRPSFPSSDQPLSEVSCFPILCATHACYCSSRPDSRVFHRRSWRLAEQHGRQACLARLLAPPQTCRHVTPSVSSIKSVFARLCLRCHCHCIFA